MSKGGTKDISKHNKAPVDDGNTHESIQSIAGCTDCETGVVIALAGTARSACCLSWMSRMCGNSVTKMGSLRLKANDLAANDRLVSSDVSMLPTVAVFSSMNDNNPDKMELTDHSGFQDSG